MKLKKYLWGILYGLVLTAFSVYVLLDTFVITRVYIREQPESTSASVSKSERAPVVTGSCYQDDNISITVTEYRYLDTSVYVADVQLSSADYLKTALAQGAYGRNVTAKTTANMAMTISSWYKT